MAAANFPDGVQTPIVFGGVTTGSRLTLQSTVLPFNPSTNQTMMLRDPVQFLPSSWTQTWAGISRVLINCFPSVTVPAGFTPDQVIALNYVPGFTHVNKIPNAGVISAIRMFPNYIWKSITPNELQLPTVRLFHAQPTFQTDTPTTGLRFNNTMQLYYSNPQLKGVQTTYTVDGMSAFVSDGPTLDRVALGTMIHYQIKSNPTILNGGTVSTLVGIDIPSLTAGTFTNVGIRSGAPIIVGTPNATPSSISAALEVQSATQAFLLPRVTTINRNAMSPLAGMMIFNLDVNAFQMYLNGAWANVQ